MIPLWIHRFSLFLWLGWTVGALSLAEGSDFVALSQLAQEVQAEFYWHPVRHVALLVKDDRRVQLAMLRGQVTFGDQFIRSDLRFDQGQPLIPTIQAQQIKAYLLGEPYELKRLSARHQVAIIMIDAGHGGRDPGSIGRHGTLVVEEKAITLAIALALEARLKKLYPDKQILMTRRNDSFPTLEERVAMANALSVGEQEAILYLSIHVNAALNEKAAGFEVWHLSQGFEREVFTSTDHSSQAQKVINDLFNTEYHSSSHRWAGMTLTAFEERLGHISPNRGIKERNWFVVRNARMAAILVEVGFLSHPEEAHRLTTPAYQERIMLALSAGIEEYVLFFEGQS
jgi:N-acetylmuramoyl-L-alanine amidase